MNNDRDAERPEGLQERLASMETVTTDTIILEKDQLPTRPVPILPISQPNTAEASPQEEAFSPFTRDISESVIRRIPVYQPTQSKQTLKQQGLSISRKKALLFIALLGIILLQSIARGSLQFTGAQGWNYILYGNPADTANTKVLEEITHHPTSSKTANTLTPQQYIKLIVSNLSVDQKIGQMMMVQFVGPDYSVSLDTMIKQYHVGSVLLFYANGNIIDQGQLKALTQQIQQASPILPMGISIDQEGGTVDRLSKLDGTQPSEAAIGATNDPNQARASGLQVAQNLASYGININLAPVVDVDNDPASELHYDARTYGTDADTVTKMAGSYLQGLQQSGKVIGTLKHFPGLGDVGTDPHTGLPSLQRTKSELEQIDWAPYRTLIKSGEVHSIMVTHEIVPAIDPDRPASLSPKLVTDILRKEMGFQGIIMTDSLTMDSIAEYYTPEQAAVDAVEAGSDIIMGANSTDDVATMVSAIKEAVASGTIPQSSIDQSVQRILMMKYQLGLLTIPTSEKR
jgi:beta-N-acetylhexosaminidase